MAIAFIGVQSRNDKPVPALAEDLLYDQRAANPQRAAAPKLARAATPNPAEKPVKRLGRAKAEGEGNLLNVAPTAQHGRS